MALYKQYKQSHFADLINDKSNDDLHTFAVSLVQRLADLGAPFPRESVAKKRPYLIVLLAMLGANDIPWEEAMGILARHLLGDLYDRCVLRLNAPYDRQVSAIRDIVGEFISHHVAIPQGHLHKIVFLDEVDSMMGHAQQTLRSTIDTHGRNVRFMLACNDSSKIIDTLQSRCTLQTFGRLTTDQVAARLEHIMKAEELTYTRQAVDALVRESEGDLRCAINNLQCVATGRKHITRESIQEIFGKPPPELIESMLMHLESAATLPDENEKALPVAMKTLAQLFALGYSSDFLVKAITDCVMDTRIFEPLKKAWILTLGRYHATMKRGLCT